MNDTPTPGPKREGLDRRAVLRRGAILGGAMVWTVPAVQTIAGPAFAAGTPCIGRVEYKQNGVCLYAVEYKADDACCDCISTTLTLLGLGPAGIVAAAAICQHITKKCTVKSAGPC